MNFSKNLSASQTLVVSPICSGKHGGVFVCFVLFFTILLISWEGECQFLPPGSCCTVTLSFQPQPQHTSSFWPGRIKMGAFQTLPPILDFVEIEIDWTAWVGPKQKWRLNLLSSVTKTGGCYGWVQHWAQHLQHCRVELSALPALRSSIAYS